MAHQTSLNIYVKLACNRHYLTIANLIKQNTQILAINLSNYLLQQTTHPPGWPILNNIFLDNNHKDTLLENKQTERANTKPLQGINSHIALENLSTNTPCSITVKTPQNNEKVDTIDQFDDISSLLETSTVV